VVLLLLLLLLAGEGREERKGKKIGS